MGEKSAIALLGIVFEHGKDYFLESMQKGGFPREMGDMELRKLLLRINEKSLFDDPHFFLSLCVGASSAVQRTEEKLGRELAGKEVWAAAKISLDEIFPLALSEKLFQYLLTNFQSFSSLTNQECKEKLKEHYDMQRKIFPEPDRKNRSMPVSMGTNTWLVSCPNCGLGKRCDAKTQRFRCKCGLESLYDGENRRFLK